jgi:heme-degrading monooxygenase HmoA
MPYAVVRHYKESQGLIDELGRRAEDVETLIRGVEGFISYALVRTDNGGYSVSIYETSDGVEESTRRAREYIQQNLSEMSVSPPEVLGGETLIQFSR